MAESCEQPIADLPEAWVLLAGLVDACRSGKLALFFDYDGTLTPIVARPEQAALPGEVRDALARLAPRVPIAIVSGRDLADVRALVGLDELWYAGSHGFEIEGPKGERFDTGSEFGGELDRATAALRELARRFPGAWVDRKRYAVALHSRAVADRRLDELEAAVRDLLAGHRELELRAGKRVFELRPASGWHKGKAARWLIDRLGLHGRTIVFFGDDTTDEDAFVELADEALTIVVGADRRPTAARYRLRDPAEVARFLAALAEGCAGPSGGDHQNRRSAR